MRNLGLFACLVTLLAACSEQFPAYPQRQPPPGFLENAVNRAAGAAIFRQNCAICHGTAGEGRSPRAGFFQPPASDFRDPGHRTLDPAYLYWRIETGKTAEPYLSRGSVMPAWGHYFSEEQIWQLVAYLRSRSGS
ncbi:MAG TPA: cytochrome c [Desulfuromonadales bacterium]|nr:cytochrome c [Desulfuromonadales bacterium]